jgi:hypothetical protein
MISDTYKELNRKLHKDNEHYGVSGRKYLDVVRPLSNHGRFTILDYGCGKATLKAALGPAYKVTNYDPCVKEYEERPAPHDIVICTDVMEHVEPEHIDNVLKDIRSLTKQVAFFSISIVPALKVLDDGRNAHISLHPIAWWKERLLQCGFEITHMFDEDGTQADFGVICK